MHMNRQRILFAIALMSLLLAAVALTSGSAISAFADNGNGQKDKSDEKDSSMKGQPSGEKNVNATGQSNAQGKDEGKESHDKGSDAEKERKMQAEKEAEEHHGEHLARNAPIVGPYTANLNYTLTASGIATSISDTSMSKDVTVSLNLAVWKSIKGLVSMDVMGGTIKIGNNESDISSGNAIYLIHAHNLLIFAHTSEDNGKIIKLKATAPEDLVLPAEKSDHALELDVHSPQSKIASEWFLKMQGEIILS